MEQDICVEKSLFLFVITNPIISVVLCLKISKIFQLLLSQSDTIHFIVLNVLISKKILIGFSRNDVNSTANRTNLIYARVTFCCVTRCQANAKGKKKNRL